MVTDTSVNIIEVLSPKLGWGSDYPDRPFVVFLSPSIQTPGKYIR
jgi:hypothetical protein